MFTATIIYISTEIDPFLCHSVWGDKCDGLAYVSLRVIKSDATGSYFVSSFLQ